jgi:acetyl esterase
VTALDPAARAYLDRLVGLPAVSELSVEEVRAGAEATAADLFGPADAVGSSEDATIPSPAGPLAVRVYLPTGSPAGTLVYLHGGGWVIGSLDTHDGVCRALAARGGCRVVSVGYRLAPEHRFPAAVDDAWAAVEWALGLGGPVAVGGDSAGGNLAAVCALRARDRGLPLALQLLVYPVTDHDLDRPSYREFAEGHGLTRDSMRWYWDHYLGPAGDGADPEASPLRAPDLAGVAPACVLVAGCDPLRDEGEEYAGRLREAGVPVTLTRYDGQIHGFFRMPAVMPRANDALDEAAAALGQAFARAGQAPPLRS